MGAALGLADTAPTLRRTTLLVSDVDASRAFYEAVGFRVWLDWTGEQDPNDPTALPLTGAPTESRIVIMAGDDDYAGMVGLLEFAAPALPPNRRVADHLGVLDIILVIEVTDLDAVLGRLERLNAEIVRAPGDYESDGPSGRKRGQDMLVRDPDGYLVELTSVTWRADD